MEKKLTPKQKRLFREEVKQLQDENKKVRLLERPEFSKKVRIAYSPTDQKRPKQQQNPDSIMQMQMEWCENSADLDGTWSWGQNRQWTIQDYDECIKYNLEQLSKLTWSQIYEQQTGGLRKRKRHRKHRDIEIAVICNEAIQRWNEIGLEEYDMAFRFRFSNLQRLWGYKIVHKFKVVWWDPEHRIYPTEKH